MKVRTIRDHGNHHGDSWAKKKGDEYSVDEKAGKALVGAGYAEEVKAEPDTKDKPAKK